MIFDVQGLSYFYYGKLLVNLRVKADKSRSDVSVVVEG